jgi:inorganic triphosphatase YgiF
VPSTLTKGGTSFLPSSNSSSPHQHRIGKVEALLLAMPTVKSEVRLKLVRTYYDTPSLALHRERLSFRVRKQGSEFVQTIKAENPTQADILERKEWED